MTKLTTHVLDVYSGKPGKGIHVELFFINNTERKKINSIKLNDDGRANSPLVEGENFVKGKYELVFYIGDYFKNTSSVSDLPFLDDVIIRFGISDPTQHYHVPVSYTHLTLPTIYSV